ncbi:MAG TPA: restriction endonuclease [candidate division Zixibacteria bacterium]|nr:restriction endonuclease [candidate division Zixibacteria bacterium]
MLIDLNLLGPRNFEDLMDDLYSRDGWNVEFHAGEGPDGKRDLIISRQITQNGESYIEKMVVQCKRSNNTVNANDVQDISDTITRYGTDGFILAVTSNISQPLLQKLDDLTKRDKICQALRPFQIHDMITRNEDIFLKYFPDTYIIYKAAKEIITLDGIKSIVVTELRSELPDTTIKDICQNVILAEIETIEDFKSVVLDVSKDELINTIYLEALKRKAKTEEQICLKVILSRYQEVEFDSIIKSYILNSSEYVSIMRFRYYFDDFPKSAINFDAVLQNAFDFVTYHESYKVGKLEVIDANIFGIKRAIKLSATTENEFCVVTLQNNLLHSKKKLSIDFNHVGYSEFFVLVRGVNNKMYFLQYINTQGTNSTFIQGNFTYIKLFGTGSNNGPMIRREMAFATDLRGNTSVEVAEFMALYLGTRNEITIYNILLV